MFKKIIAILGALVFMALLSNGHMLLNDAAAYNKPWDQGHDYTNPNDPDDPDNPDGPPNNPCGGTGSPVYTQSGALVRKMIDLTFQACGKPIKVTREYNSFDEHNGLLGYGWTLSYSIRLLDSRTPDGIAYAVVIMPNGQRYQFDKDAGGNYVSPPGTVFTLTKNATGFLLTDALGLNYIFDSDGFITKIIDQNQNEVSLTYQNFGGCLDQITDGSGRTLSFTFGANGKISSITDPVGNTFLYEQDNNGDLVKVTDPSGGVTQYSYDSRHNLTGIVNHLGVTELSVTYQTSDPYKVGSYSENGETYTYTYQTASTLKKNSLNQTTTYAYDTNGLITGVTTPLSHVTNHTYDANYSYIQYKNPNGDATSFAYDTNRNLVEIEKANTKKYMFDRTPQGDVSKLTDPAGNFAQFTYDANSNLTGITRANGDTLTIGYDAKGYLTAITKGSDSLLMERDSHCNLTRMRSSSGAEVNITYDPLGNPVSINQDGTLTTYGYNSLNKIINATTGGVTTTINYDGIGRVSQVIFPGGILGYSYSNTYGILNKISFPDGSSYDYDFYSYGRLKTLNDMENQTRSYLYDADHRLTQVTFPSGRTVAYQYDNGKNVTRIVDSALGTIDCGHDVLNRITSVSDGSFTDQYAYDDAGNRSTRTDTANQVTQYAYDTLSRLTQISYPDGTSQSFSPAVMTPGQTITLNDIIGLYNSRQNVRLLSYLIAFSSDQIVKNIRYDLQYTRFLNGLNENLLTGFSAYELPYSDSYAVPQISILMDELSTYSRLGLN